jgi:hypothetical protein
MAVVQFDVANGPTFSVSSGVQEYLSLGLTLCFNPQHHFLTAIQVDLGARVGTDEEFLQIAREKIAALLEYIEFRTGSPIRLGNSYVSGIRSNPGLTTVTCNVSCDAVIAPPILMVPSERDLRGLFESTELRLQLLWFNRGKASDWVVDKIRTLYGVLEIEREAATNKGGNPLWDELKIVRDAVSHPFFKAPSHRRVREYLQRNLIGATRLHFDNNSHMEFLLAKARILEDEVRNLLQRKLEMV